MILSPNPYPLLFRPHKHLHIFLPLPCQPLLTILVAGLDERAEERMRLERLGLEFGMELAAEEEGMVGNLDDLDVGAVGRGAGDAHAGAGEQRFVFAVEFVAMAVALADFASGRRLVRRV